MAADLNRIESTMDAIEGISHLKNIAAQMLFLLALVRAYWAPNAASVG